LLSEARVDVLVIGAGPAGSAAAIALARGGARVAVADRAAFPRDKVCGDGLLPDAARTLAGLIGDEALRQLGQKTRGILFRAPGGKEGTVPVPGLVVPRLRLDALLLERAADAGADVLREASLEGFEGEPGRWRAARLRTARGRVALGADRFVLATGAMPRPRILAGLGELGRCGAAVRGYARIDGLPDDTLVISFERAFPGGYLWAFPLGGGLWNVGCGVFDGCGSPRLAELATAFLARLGVDTWQQRPRGAPLAAAFPRPRAARGNVLAVGDAAGLTRPFSGEGIGPALASGVLAARCLLEHGDGAAGRYENSLLARYRSEFRAWRLGERLLRRPRLVDATVARVESSRSSRERIKSVLADRSPTRSVLSTFGIIRLLLGL
jgi:geranylgeranyl reductase family protein